MYIWKHNRFFDHDDPTPEDKHFSYLPFQKGLDR